MAPMIHIHNGDVTASLAQRALIEGEHLPFRESLISGPVLPDLPIESRATWLASTSDQEILRVSNDLFEQDQKLTAALQQDEVVLWFEHDLFCLVHFVYLLQRLGAALRLSYVWHPQPLGLLEEHELPLLFESRAAVTPAMLETAAAVWSAYTFADPRALARWTGADSTDLPFLREGLLLHASRFPSTRNGLGSIENRLLTHIAAGPVEFAPLFDQLIAAEPHLGFGDSEIRRILRQLASRTVPLITMAEGEGESGPTKALCTITPAGENVLRGEVDDTRVNDPDVWLGGVHVTKENLWRWDENERVILPSPSAAS